MPSPLRGDRCLMCCSIYVLTGVWILIAHRHIMMAADKGHRGKDLSELEGYGGLLGWWNSFASSRHRGMSTATLNLGGALEQLRSQRDTIMDDIPQIPELSSPLFDQSQLLSAGFPRYRANFARDSILGLLLMRDLESLRHQLQFSAAHQGEKADRITGEEPGKIPHEIPGKRIGPRNLGTKYSACDTTGLFLIGMGVLCGEDNPSEKIDGETAMFCQAPRTLVHVQAALSYIEQHVDESGLFLEDPSRAGASAFALDVTYWKDSILPGQDAIPYPRAYSLVQAIYLKAIRAAGKLRASTGFLLSSERRDSLRGLADKMRTSLRSLFNSNLDHFPAAVHFRTDPHGQGEAGAYVKSVSSDSLQLLYFLERGDLPLEWMEGIVSSSMKLETEVGYITSPVAESHRELAGKGKFYHQGTVWPFEQAMIHAAALKHGLERARNISGRIEVQLIKSAQANMAPEYFVFDGSGSPTHGGCTLQLWSLAAVAYFRNAMKIRGSFPDLDTEPYRSCWGHGNSKIEFECKGRNGQKVQVHCSRVNDDYCDCLGDGIDEAATPACNLVRKGDDARFFCANGKESTFLSRIGDNIRDCTDGSDEEPLQTAFTSPHQQLH